jgi:hypothetical protein
LRFIHERFRAKKGEITPENCVLLLDHWDFCPGELTLPVFFQVPKKKNMSRECEVGFYDG